MVSSSQHAHQTVSSTVSSEPFDVLYYIVTYKYKFRAVDEDPASFNVNWHEPVAENSRLTIPLLRRTGVLCFFLCFALGIANIFHLGLLILFSIICL